MATDWHAFTAGLRGYLQQYARDHAQPSTRLTHLVGIPMIVAALPVALRRPKLGAGLFVAGGRCSFLATTASRKKVRPSLVIRATSWSARCGSGSKYCSGSAST